MKKSNFSLTLIILLINFNLYAGIYRWVDAQNNMQYGQVPPEGVQATEVTPPPPPPTQKGITEQQRLNDALKQMEDENNKRTAEKEEAEKAVQIEQIRAKNCHQAKAALENLQHHPRVRMMDASGNVTRLTEQQHAQEMLRAQAAVKQFCPPP